jgi:hypothetical protein
MGVGQDFGAFGHPGLNRGAWGHRPVAAFEEGGEIGENGRVFAQRSAEQFSDPLTGEIIGGGSESAGGDDPIGASEGFGDGLLNRDSRVGHGHLALHGIPGVGKLPTEPLLMGIEHPAKHEFAAGVDDLDVHGGNVSAGAA